MRRIFAVFSQGQVSDGGDLRLIEDLESMHVREWSADWHAYRLALRDTALYGPHEWMPTPEQGVAGWAHDLYDEHASIVVKPVDVLI